MEVDAYVINEIEGLLDKFSDLYVNRVNQIEQGYNVESMFSWSFEVRKVLDAFIEEEAKEKDLQLLGAISSLWHLVEAFFLCPEQEFKRSLLAWCQERNLEEGVNNDLDFWGILKNHLLSGCFDEVRDMLHESDYAELIVVIPKDETSLLQRDLRRLVAEKRKKFAAHPSAVEMLSIISGDLEAIVENCNDWITLTFARILFCNERPEGAIVAQSLQLLKKKPSSIPIGSFEMAVLATIERNPEALLRYCDETIQQEWFSFHLFYILTDSMFCQVQAEMVEERLKHYCFYMREIPVLRPIIFKYAKSSSDYHKLLNELFTSLTPENEEETRMLLKQIPLYSEAFRGICRNQAQAMWSDPGAAIKWYLEAKDTGALIDYIEDMLSVAILKKKSSFGMTFENENAFLKAAENVTSMLSQAGENLEQTTDMALLQNYYNIISATQEIVKVDGQLQASPYSKAELEKRQRELFNALFQNLMHSRKLNRKFYIPIMIQVSKFFEYEAASTMSEKVYDTLINGIFENTLHYDVEFEKGKLDELKKNLLHLYVRIFSSKSFASSFMKD